jgi:hypothetical protein
MFDGSTPEDRKKVAFEAFPKGFQLVAGSAGLRTSNKDSKAAQASLWYVCDADRSIYYPGFPVKRACKTLTVGINFR